MKRERCSAEIDVVAPAGRGAAGFGATGARSGSEHAGRSMPHGAWGITCARSLGRSVLVALLVIALGVSTRPAHAQTDEPADERDESSVPAWPVRVNLSMPLGHTWGREKLHGFTWGFRGALQVYPTATARGAGFGGYAEMLLDTRTHSMWSYGALITAPVVSFVGLDLRVGGFAGPRGSGEGGDDARRLALGALTELVFPAYVYDFTIGVRLDGTFDDDGASAASLLFELELIGVLALVASAGAR